MSGQLLSRENAIKELKKFVGETSFDRPPGAGLSPAEHLLLDAVVGLNLYLKRSRSQHTRLSNIDMIAYKRVKFIARSLGLTPIKQEYVEAYLVRGRMKVPRGAMHKKFDYVDGKKKYVYWIAKEDQDEN